MYRIVVFLALSCINLTICANKYENIPDYALRLEQRVVKDGYPIEIYQIITEDGYILAAYRIPHGLKKEEPENKNKTVVLIVHGMGGSPHNFIILGENRAIPYYLADRGMDVWLFSSRASETPFDKQHITLDWNKDSAFWLHSFHELGIYDLAATIDFVLNRTGQEKLHLIGHSAGGTEFFALMSEKPEYNKKVKLAVAWGSSPILRRMDYPILTLGSLFGNVVKTFTKFVKMTELIPEVIPNLKPILIELYLKRDPLWYNMLKYSLACVGSHNSVITLDEYNPMVISNIPRLSTRQIFHFLDNAVNGTFRKFDFGPKGNLKHYGQPDPPPYNLSAVTTPVAFFNGALDGYISLLDVYECIQNLPNVVFLYKIPFKKFTHTDYIFGYNATEMVYEPTYQMIMRVEKGDIPPPVKVPADYN